MTALGDYVKDKLREQGWSLRAFAERIDASHSTISRVLNGDGSQAEETLRKIADGLPGVSFSTLRQLAVGSKGDLEPFKVPVEFDRLDRDERRVVLAVGRQLLVSRGAAATAGQDDTTPVGDAERGGTVTAFPPAAVNQDGKRVTRAARKREPK